jgi:hypothetical protein
VDTPWKSWKANSHFSGVSKCVSVVVGQKFVSERSGWSIVGGAPCGVLIGAPGSRHVQLTAGGQEQA